MMERIEKVRFRGDCLAALGFPDEGFAIVDREAKPRVFDVVWCEGIYGGEIGGKLKQIVKTGKDSVVRAMYEDPTRNYMYHPAGGEGWKNCSAARNLLRYHERVEGTEAGIV